METVGHLLCNCLALSKLRLMILGRGFFESLNSVSRTNIKAFHRFLSGLRCLGSTRALSVWSRSLLFVLVCVISPPPILPFLLPVFFHTLLLYFIFRTFVQLDHRVSVDKYTSSNLT